MSTAVLLAALFAAPGAIAIDDTAEFSVELEYFGFGIASQPARMGVIQLMLGQEKAIASLAIVNGLTSLGNVIENTRLDTILDPESDWTTNIASLDRKLVAEYNEKLDDATHKLPVDRLYGIQYSGQYLLREEQLRFKITSRLFQRGTSTDFIAYEAGSYDAGYFFERARAAIGKALAEAAKRPDARSP